jgi:hypothetical protein
VNEAEIRRRFTHASKDFVALNADAGLQSAQPKHVPADALDQPTKGGHQGSGRVVVRITLCRVRVTDLDNAYGGLKPLIDALVLCELIDDDDPASIRLEVSQQKVGRLADQKTKIELIYE